MHVLTAIVVGVYLVALLTLIVATSLLLWQLSRPEPARIRRRVRNIAIATTTLAAIAVATTIVFGRELEVATSLLVLRSVLLCLAAAMSWGAYIRSASDIRGTGVWCFMFENILVVVFAMTFSAALRTLWNSRHPS